MSDRLQTLSLERTIEVINDFCADFPVAYAIDFRVNATQEELYGSQASKERVGLIKGAYVPATAADQASRQDYRGRCDIAYANHRDEDDLRRSLYHEIAGHFGLNTSSSPEAKRALLESITLSRSQPGIADLWQKVESSYPDADLLIQAEEVYCSLSENLERYPNLLPNRPSALERIETQGPQKLELYELQDIVAHVATGLHLATRDQRIFPQTAAEQFSRARADKPDTAPKVPYHEEVAAALIRQIESGTSPWQKPWNSDGSLIGLPMNPVTQQRYRGINTVHLIAQGRGDPRWMTYKQAQSIGAQVRKGEKGVSIQYWKFDDTRDQTDEQGRPVTTPDGQVVQEQVRLDRPRVFYATVFNAEQIEGLAPMVRPERTWDPVQEAELILSASGAHIEHRLMDRAYYSPSIDQIHLPEKGQFDSAQGYYATALHELGHWSGHSTRLNRDLAHPFGSEGYAREELRAEIASMLLTAQIGLPHDTQSHASYVGSWVKVLKQDPLEIFRAAADAEKIHAFVMGFAPDLAQQMQPKAATPTISPDPSPQDLSTAQDLTMDTSTGFSSPSAVSGASRERIPMTLNEVSDALSFISPNMPRDDWARLAMAIKSEFPGDDGLAVFEQWSSTAESYRHDAVVSTWRSIKSNGGVTLGSLIKIAKDNGYVRNLDGLSVAREFGPNRSPSPNPKVDPAVEAAELLKQHQTTAQQAQQLWDAALPSGESAYLLRKQVGMHNVRLTANGTLVVPLVDEQGTLWNVQRILSAPLADGNDKLYMKGGRKSGLSHVLGNLELESNQPILFAEGYSTAASLHEATGWPTVMTMDSGNLPKVVALYRARYPQRLFLVGADDDQATLRKEGYNPGVLKATEAAEKSAAWVVMPSARDGQNTDFNDIWVQEGAAAPAIIRSLFQKRLEQVLEQSDGTGSVALTEALDALRAPSSVPTIGQSQGSTTAETLSVDSTSTHQPSISSPVDQSNQGTGSANDVASTTSTFVPPTAETSASNSTASISEPVSPASLNSTLNMAAVNAQRTRDTQTAAAELRGNPSIQSSFPAEGGPPAQTALGTVDDAGAPRPTVTAQQLDALAQLRAELAQAFEHDGQGKYYFRGTPQGLLAFEDKGSSFVSSHHSPEVVSSIARLAHAKGWTQIRVNGSSDFMRQMWIEASLLGLKVSGYDPQPIDWVHLKERRDQGVADGDASTRPNRVDNAGVQVTKTLTPGLTESEGRSSAVTPGNAPVHLSSIAAQQLDGQIRARLLNRGAKDEQAIDRTLKAIHEQVKSPRVYVGEVVEQGEAPYQFKANEKQSPYVVLKTDSGTQTVWGVDLPRALSDVRVGQEIVLAYQGTQMVKVPVMQSDDQGQSTSGWETVKRNAWFAQPIEQAYEQVLHTSPLAAQTNSGESAVLDATPFDALASRSPTSPAPALWERQDMREIPSAQERLRRALLAQGADESTSQITIGSLNALLESPKFYVGKVIEQGAAQRDFVPGNPESYYLRLQTEQGVVMVWSSELASVSQQSGVAEGETVVVAYKGLQREADGLGQIESKNTWFVQSLKDLHAQAQKGVVVEGAEIKAVERPEMPPASMTGQEQLMFVFQSALHQAGVPRSLAMETLVMAQQAMVTQGTAPQRAWNAPHNDRSAQILSPSPVQSVPVSAAAAPSPNPVSVVRPRM